MEEKSGVMLFLLDFVYPDAQCHKLEELQFDGIWALLLAAHKYMFQKILDEFRLRLLSDSYFSKNPLEAYVIASHYEWESEMNNLMYNAVDHIHKESSSKILAKLDHIHTLKLQKSAAMRKNAILNIISRTIREQYVPDYEYQLIDDVDWDTAKFRKIHNTVLALVNLEIDKFPSCGTVLDQSFWMRPEVKGVIEPYTDTKFYEEIWKNLLSASSEVPNIVNIISLDKEYNSYTSLY